MCKCPYTETVQSPNRLVHYALVFQTPATRRNPTNKIGITLKIEQAVLNFYIRGTRSLRIIPRKYLMWKACRNGQTNSNVFLLPYLAVHLNVSLKFFESR